MTIEELVETGVCEDIEEALCMFPVEVFEDLAPARRPGDGPNGENPGCGVGLPLSVGHFWQDGEGHQTIGWPMPT